MSDVINGVPRELLESLPLDFLFTHGYNQTAAKLSALLSEQPQASAAQSAPAGEREAFDAWFDATIRTRVSYGNPDTLKNNHLPAFQAGAAWQRTQSAGVPGGWKLVPEQPTDSMVQAVIDSGYYATPATAWPILVEEYKAMLAAAPAQPAAQDEEGYSTTSDRYRAELYDEVWQKARDMGYGNVTEALLALESSKAAAQDQGEVQRLRDALEAIADCTDDDQARNCALIALASRTWQEK